MRTLMLCSEGPHSVWQYTQHAAYARLEPGALQDDAARDEKEMAQTCGMTFCLC